MRLLILTLISITLFSCVRTDFAYKYKTNDIRSYVVKKKGGSEIQIALTYTNTNYRVIVRDLDLDFKSDEVSYIDKDGNEITQNRMENPNSGFFWHADAILKSVKEKEGEVKKKVKRIPPKI